MCHDDRPQPRGLAVSLGAQGREIGRATFTQKGLDGGAGLLA
jgi:hypothetical protein